MEEDTQGQEIKKIKKNQKKSKKIKKFDGDIVYSSTKKVEKLQIFACIYEHAVRYEYTKVR